MDDDRRLVARVQAGEREAFRDLVGRHENLVAHVVYRMVRHSADREELCQEVFVRVYRKLGSFRFESKLSTWIAKLAYHACLNHLKKRRLLLYDDLGRRANPGGAAPDRGIEPADRSATPLDAAEAAELRSFVRAQVEALPWAYRAVVTLYHLEGMSVAEVGEVTGMPTGTVKNYLFRARRVLKDRLLSTYSVNELQP